MSDLTNVRSCHPARNSLSPDVGQKNKEKENTSSEGFSGRHYRTEVEIIFIEKTK